MIARTLRRPGPIPFAPLPPLAERLPLARLLAPLQEGLGLRDARPRSRWQPTLVSANAALPPSSNETLTASAPATGARTPRQPCLAVYHGQGTLSVLSSITGHRYRFEGHGCTLSIDPRDRLVLARLNDLSIQVG